MVENSTTSGWRTIGHDWVISTLTNHIQSGHIRHAYLFAGPPSIGKGSLAIDFARSICCLGNPGAPCGNCRPCKLITKSKHPDVVEINPRTSGKTIKQEKLSVDDIRNTIYRFTLNPVELPRRIAIINNFETASRFASDAILKTLEEPPGNSVFIITTDHAASLAETVLSRCVRFNLRPLPVGVVEQTLLKGWGAQPQNAYFLAQISGGRIGWAINLLSDEKALEARSKKLLELVDLLSLSRVSRFAYVDEMRKDREQAVITLVLWEGWWRDVMIVSAGTENVDISNVDYKNEVNKVASQVSAANIANTISAIRNTQQALNKNANARLALEVLMLQIPTINTVT